MAARILPIEMARSVALSSLSLSCKVLLSGDEGARSLALRITAGAACLNHRVRFICGDNRFDAYAIARLAKIAGVRAEIALSSIQIARAFTAYQLVELVERLEPDRGDDLIVVSGPCSPFFDEDLSHTDAARLFYRTLWRCVELARGGMKILLVQGKTAACQRRGYFLTDLSRLSDVVLRFNGETTFTLERRKRLSLPQIARFDDEADPLSLN
jgi:hypothetical protein